jgi:hypothetical protein
MGKHRQDELTGLQQDAELEEEEKQEKAKAKAKGVRASLPTSFPIVGFMGGKSRRSTSTAAPPADGDTPALAEPSASVPRSRRTSLFTPFASAADSSTDAEDSAPRKRSGPRGLASLSISSPRRPSAPLAEGSEPTTPGTPPRASSLPAQGSSKALVGSASSGDEIGACSSTDGGLSESSASLPQRRSSVRPPRLSMDQRLRAARARARGSSGESDGDSARESAGESGA